MLHFQQQRELVAAQASQGIAFAQLAFEQLGQLAQQFIARRVAAGVVNHLELIKIHVTQRMFPILLQRRQQRVLQAPLELAPVDESRQAIVAGLINQARGGLIDFFLHLALHGLEMGRHVIDATLQRAKFGLAVLLDSFVQVSLADAAHRVGQGQNRPRDLTADAPGKIETDP